MVRDKHKQYVLEALSVMKDCAKVDKHGKISYTVTYEYQRSRLILKTMVNLNSLTNYQHDSCLSKALSKYILDRCSGLEKFLQYLTNEIRGLDKDLKNPYLVIRSAYTKIPVELRRRKLFGALICSGKAFEVDGRFVSTQLKKPTLSAIQSRKALKKVSEKEYFPNYIEGNLFFTAQVNASNVTDAKDRATFALDSYLGLLNFVTGFGQGKYWDINPQQPEGTVIPSAYTTIHKKSGRLLDNYIYYDPELSLVRSSGKSINTEFAKKIDLQIDYVLKKLKKHFDSKTVLDGIGLLGQAYTATDKNNTFLKCWMVLERLMYFSASESHDAMLKRIRFLLTEDFVTIEKGLLESLRLTRNLVAHHGLDMNDVPIDPFFSPTTALFGIVNKLLKFHLHLPSAITSKDDFIQFTKLPTKQESLKGKKALTEAMLNRVR